MIGQKGTDCFDGEKDAFMKMRNGNRAQHRKLNYNKASRREKQLRFLKFKTSIVMTHLHMRSFFPFLRIVYGPI